MTDEAILALIQQPGSNEDGFRQLVIKYQQRLYQVIRRRLPAHTDTDDVLQNTFVKVFRHIGSFEGRSELYTWMYRIACNEVINFQKTNNRSRYSEMAVHFEAPAEAYLDADKLTQSLEAAVKRLPERQQMVFRMRYYDELPYKEMAQMLNLTEGALKASFHHAVKKIEEEFRAKQIL
ncbi:MAG: RNA polymerase sigma factor [Bacteroidota bacterium]|nr:RNA polymerase sigma factor [Bacteroidota bacterium]